MVADFGIALAVSAAAGGRMTETGLSLGTPHYMSPEQATAEKEITGRSDIYSLGSVLYEMLTGNPPHVGSSAQQIIMKIVTEEAVPVTSVRKSVPPNVAAAVAKALEKLPADRFESAKAFTQALDNPAFTFGSTAGPMSRIGSGPFVRRRVVVGVGAGVLAAAVLLGTAISRRPPATPPVVRFTVNPPPGTDLANDPLADAPFALSPNGTLIALVARDTGDVTTRLYIRATDQLDAVPVPGTEGAIDPFFAPDGRTLGFVSSVDGKMRKVGVDGGPVTTIAGDAVLVGSTPSWGDDGYVVFLGADYRLRRVSATGGRSRSLDSALARRRADAGVLDTTLAYPVVLPGGRAVIVSACYQGIMRGSGFCLGRIQIVDLGTGQRTPLGVGGARGWYADGYLVFVTGDGTVFAAALDVKRGTLKGEPVALLDGLGGSAFQGGPRVALAASGALVYLGAATGVDRVVVQVDRSGRERVIVETPGRYEWVRLFPDETRIAMVAPDVRGDGQVYVHDRRSGTTLPVTFDGEHQRPSWSPDGRRVAFSSRHENRSDVWTAPADGSAPAEPVAAGKDVIQHTATSWTRDGRFIVIDGTADVGASASTDDIFALPASGSGTMQPVVATPASEQTGEVSPDGRWIAYVSDDAGFFQVYLQAFLRAGGRTLVSAGPAIEPAWVSSHELTYTSVASDSLILARLEFGESVGIVRTALLDRSRYTPGAPSWRQYDVSRDGQRFIFTRSQSGADAASPVIVLNWTQEIRRVLATQSPR